MKDAEIKVDENVYLGARLQYSYLFKIIGQTQAGPM
jgi:hypothetical protein